MSEHDFVDVEDHLNFPSLYLTLVKINIKNQFVCFFSVRIKIPKIFKKRRVRSSDCGLQVTTEAKYRKVV